MVQVDVLVVESEVVLERMSERGRLLTGVIDLPWAGRDTPTTKRAASATIGTEGKKKSGRRRSGSLLPVVPCKVLGEPTEHSRCRRSLPQALRV